MKLLTLLSASLLHLQTPFYLRCFNSQFSLASSTKNFKTTPIPCKEVYRDASVLEHEYLLNIESKSRPPFIDAISFEQNKALIFEQPSVKPLKSVATRRHLPPLTIDDHIYKNCCFDRLSRTRPNPRIASHALIIADQAYFYTPPVVSLYKGNPDLCSSYGSEDFSQSFSIVPEYTVLSELYDSSPGAKHSKYIGRSKNGLTMYGTHMLDLTISAPEFSAPIPAKMVSFYPHETSRKEPYWCFQETISPLFSAPHWGQKIKALSAALQKELFATTTQGNFQDEFSGAFFPFRVIDNLEIDLGSIQERKKLPRRKPSQKTVMGHSSSDEMISLLNSPLAQSVNIKIREFIASCITTYADNYAPKKAEWLHLVAFGCTPIEMNPQTTTNLVASSASLNTEQMCTESILQCLGQRAYELGYQNTDLRLSIKKSFFELIPTTNIASYMSYNTRIELPSTGRTVETHQQYASLQEIPSRHKVDVGAACVIFSKFLQGQAPCHTIKIKTLTKHP